MANRSVNTVFRMLVRKVQDKYSLIAELNKAFDGKGVMNRPKVWVKTKKIRGPGFHGPFRAAIENERIVLMEYDAGAFTFDLKDIDEITFRKPSVGKGGH